MTILKELIYQPKYNSIGLDIFLRVTVQIRTK